jgi:hypothetical protein
MLPHNRHRHGLPQAARKWAEISGGVVTFASSTHDHVAGFDTGLFRRRTLHHSPHQDAFANPKNCASCPSIDSAYTQHRAAQTLDGARNIRHVEAESVGHAGHEGCSQPGHDGQWSAIAENINSLRVRPTSPEPAAKAFQPLNLRAIVLQHYVALF